MESEKTTETASQEAHAAGFIDRGRIYTPERDTLARTFARLFPAKPDASFPAVEIGHGRG